jgi:hypothetical protein
LSPGTAAMPPSEPERLASSGCRISETCMKVLKKL